MINKTHGLQKSHRKLLDRSITLGGVGKGTQESTHSVTVPCCINNEPSEFVATVLDNSDIPAILGMESLQSRNAILDLVNDVMIIPSDPSEVQINVSKTTKIFQLKQAPGGYLMLPCTPGTKILIDPKEYHFGKGKTNYPSSRKVTQRSG